MQVVLNDFTVYKNPQYNNMWLGVGRKDEDDNWENTYIKFSVPKDKANEIPSGDENNVVKFKSASGFLTYYYNNDGDTTIHFVATEFEVEKPKTYKRNNKKASK